MTLRAYTALSEVPAILRGLSAKKFWELYRKGALTPLTQEAPHGTGAKYLVSVGKQHVLWHSQIWRGGQWENTIFVYADDGSKKIELPSDEGREELLALANAKGANMGWNCSVRTGKPHFS